MSIEKVREFFKQYNKECNIIEHEVSSATVELAAEAVGVTPSRIAKTLSFKNKEGNNAILIVTSGDVKIDNKKFKLEFGHKAKMLTPEEVLKYIGHVIGGVCPFAIKNDKVQVYLDISLKRFDTIFPAAGSSNSSIELTCDELERFSHANKWVDVCKGYEDKEIV